MELHPKILMFAEMMQHEMNANSDKGDWEMWGDYKEQLSELIYHTEKLEAAINTDNANAIKEHSADVANFCMMIVNCCGWFEVIQNQKS